MIGSARQIEWATEIKAKIAAEAQQSLGKSEKYDRVINHILSIEHASFWIDYRDYSFRTLLTSLQQPGLSNKGFVHSNNIKIDSFFTITETWTEIIPDDKGGHYETKTKTW